jgi:hypothetical protein
MSRARVTQILNLLKLDTEVQEMVVRTVPAHEVDHLRASPGRTESGGGTILAQGRIGLW